MFTGSAVQDKGAALRTLVTTMPEDDDDESLMPPISDTFTAESPGLPSDVQSAENPHSPPSDTSAQQSFPTLNPPAPKTSENGLTSSFDQPHPCSITNPPGCPPQPLFLAEQLGVDRRLLVNRKRQLKMYRVWMQGKFRKLSEARAYPVSPVAAPDVI